MSKLVDPIFCRDYALEFEEYREDRILENQLKVITALRNESPANIQSRDFQTIFTDCLAHCKKDNFRMGYRLTAFAAFGGVNDYADFPGNCGSALLYAIHDKRSTLEMVDELLASTLKERLISIDSVVRRIERVRRCNINTTKEIIQEHQTISESEELGEEWVSFSHGGGFQSIHHFFILRDWEGYECDLAIDGTWVTPSGSGYENRDLYYACRTPPKHFDTPCVVKGEIQRKYLSSCPNAYELKITPSNVDKIKNITLQCFPGKIGASYAHFPILLSVNLHDSVSKEMKEKFVTLFAKYIIYQK